MRLGLGFTAAAAALVAGCGGGGENAEPANEAGNVSANEAVNAAMPEATAAESNAAAPAAEAAPGNEAAAEEAPTEAAEKAPAAEPKAAAAAAEEAPAPAKTIAAAVPSDFARCRACHSVEPGKHGVGPSLAGVVGDKAGSKPGYNYSDAMKNSGIVWSRDRLDAFILAPRSVVPGTKMVIAGPKDAAARQRIVDYLATLR